MADLPVRMPILTLSRFACSFSTLHSIDPFLNNEPNPNQTHALDSSLWELLSHTSHYHAPVSTMCKIFSEAFTKPHYAMEDFLDHTYNTVRSLTSFPLSNLLSNKPAIPLTNILTHNVPAFQ